MVLTELLSATTIGVLAGFIFKNKNREVKDNLDYISKGVASIIVACIFVFIFKTDSSMWQVIGTLTYMNTIEQIVILTKQKHKEGV